MKRSKFSLSHNRATTCEMGQLVPIMCAEVLPGDTIQQATSCLIRVAPMVAPVMHPVHARIHHWFVPTRLIWDGFESFITGGPDGNDATVHPTISLASGGNSTPLALHLGVPVAAAPVSVSALPFRAVNLIFNENYRDADLQAELAISKASGVDVTTSTGLPDVCWDKDYFTSARPWTQKGDEVAISLGTSAPVEGTIAAQEVFFRANADGTGLNHGLYSLSGGSNINPVNSDQVANIHGFLPAHDPAGLTADLTGASAITINDLREAFAMQNYKEARAKFGSRYTEYLRYLGINPADARLERPEYLGGGKDIIQFSEVLQTGTTTSGIDLGVGNMKGHGIGAMRSNRYRKYFQEHGFILSFLIVMPRTMYCQGLSKMWTRSTKEDYHQRELEHIGQAEVKIKELYIDAANREAVFGYQDRYDEYRRMESSVSGKFIDELDFWHMARIFGSEPALNSDFVTANPTKRYLAETGGDTLYVMAHHSIQARRPLSRRG